VPSHMEAGRPIACLEHDRPRRLSWPFRLSGTDGVTAGRDMPERSLRYEAAGLQIIGK
jgi:hypothetical protein